MDLVFVEADVDGLLFVGIELLLLFEALGDLDVELEDLELVALQQVFDLLECFPVPVVEALVLVAVLAVLENVADWQGKMDHEVVVDFVAFEQLRLNVEAQVGLRNVSVEGVARLSFAQRKPRVVVFRRFNHSQVVVVQSQQIVNQQFRMLVLNSQGVLQGLLQQSQRLVVVPRSSANFGQTHHRSYFQ